MSAPKVQTPKDYAVEIGSARLSKRGQKPHANLHCPISKQGIEFRSEALSSFNLTQWEPVLFDGLLVAAAMEFCDMHARRGEFCWGRSFQVAIPVHQPERWNAPEIKNRLETTLSFLTGDRWKFSFQQLIPDADIPPSLEMPIRYEHVMAYSDGVDSRCVAGLYDKASLARVRVGKNAKDRTKGEPFTAIPFKVNSRNTREDSARSRGFKFAMISALAAYVCQSRSIIVPESGQGAIGTILAAPARIYPDYRNHPAFFRRMERFLKALLDHDFQFEQPRIWSTKGQTIGTYLRQPGADLDRLLATRSCWQERFNVRLDGRKRQCGLCAACLLRRLSFSAAGQSEPEGTYVWEDLTASDYEQATPPDAKPTKSMVAYGTAGVQSLEQLARLHETGHPSILSGHAAELAVALNLPEPEVHAHLGDLLKQHHQEWTQFKKELGGKSFIRAWAGDAV